MNCIFYALYNEHHLPLIKTLSDAFPIEFCHVIGNTESNLIKVPFIKEAQFHNWHEISSGYRDVDWSEIKPLDADIIEKMRECEVQVLRMMDRKTSNVQQSWSYADRKRVYYQHLRYWNHLLEIRKFDLFFSLNIPHEILDFIICNLCWTKGIQTFFFYQFQPDITFLMRDWKDPFPKFNQAKNSNLELSKSMTKEFLLRTGEKQPVPFYLKNDLKNRIIKRFASTWRTLKSPRGLPRSLLLYLHVLKLEKQYKNALYTPQEGDQYIYFPLHLQPELSTSPMAGAFVDQHLILEILARSIPENFLIYVKEHPTQNLQKRSTDFYSKLTRISKARLISTAINSSELSKGSLAVATATGTAGWEALFLGKNVLLFGNTFYQYCQGVFQIRSEEDCKSAMDKILSCQARPTLDDIKSFLAKISPWAIEGNIDTEYRVASDLDKNTDLRNLASALLREVNQGKN